MATFVLFMSCYCKDSPIALVHLCNEQLPVFIPAAAVTDDAS